MGFLVWKDAPSSSTLIKKVAKLTSVVAIIYFFVWVKFWFTLWFFIVGKVHCFECSIVFGFLSGSMFSQLCNNEKISANCAQTLSLLSEMSKRLNHLVNSFLIHKTSYKICAPPFIKMPTFSASSHLFRWWSAKATVRFLSHYPPCWLFSEYQRSLKTEVQQRRNFLSQSFTIIIKSTSINCIQAFFNFTAQFLFHIRI